MVKLKDKKCVAVLGTCLDKVYGNPHSLDQVRHGKYDPNPPRFRSINTIDPGACQDRWMELLLGDLTYFEKTCCAQSLYDTFTDVCASHRLSQVVTLVFSVLTEYDTIGDHAYR